MACTEYAGKEVEKMAAKAMADGEEVTENAVKMVVLALVGECLYEKAFGSAIDPDNAKAAYDSVMEAIATCGNPDEALAAVSILSLHSNVGSEGHARLKVPDT